jgi:glyoxylase-like metal-dependent hydrolase (beta-lactamase superfamily II)
MLMVVFVVILAVGATATAETEADGLFRVKKLTDRVYIFTEVTPWESNHVVILGENRTVLVDPGHSALMGRLIREAVAGELEVDRFDYVVNTHGHWGHTWGNSGFPEAAVVGHDQAAVEIDTDAPNVQQRREFIRGQLEQSEARLTELDAASEEAETERIQRDHFDRIVRGLSEPGFTVRSPGLTFSERMSLDLGNLSLEMHYFGRAHSTSDIAIIIPEEKVALIGCFFLERGVLPAFGTQPVLDPDQWLEVFDRVLDDSSGIEHIVLGQHHVWPRERLATMRDYIADLWTGVQALDAEGVDFDTVVEKLPIPSELDFVKAAGATDDQLAQLHRFELSALWRQLKVSAVREVAQSLDEDGLEAGLRKYKALAAAGEAEVFFDENGFNMLGYRLLGQNRVDEAIAVFEINVERFPESWNVHDSLGEAYAVKGDTGKAIELYRRSVELNPENVNGVQALERLQTANSKGPDES